MAVVDGRPELAEEIRSGPEYVRAFVAAEIAKLLATREFLDALPGYLSPISEPGSRLHFASPLERHSSSLIGQQFQISAHCWHTHVQKTAGLGG